MCKSAGGQNELEKLRALLCAERSRNQQMIEIISSLKQDKELLQHELTKKAELICDFLQDKLRPGRAWFENPPVYELWDNTVYPYGIIGTAKTSSLLALLYLRCIFHAKL